MEHFDLTMELANLGTTVFVRTPHRGLELRWYSPLVVGAVEDILTNVVRRIRESFGQGGDAGTSDWLRRAFGASIQSSHAFPACCEGDIRISFEFGGRAELTVAEHCERSLSAARAAALDATAVRTEPWHDGVPELLAAQIPDRLSLEFTENGVFFIFRGPAGFETAASAMTALLAWLFGDRWKEASGRDGTRVGAVGLEMLLRPRFSHSQWEDEFFIGSEWLFGLRTSAHGSTESIGLAVTDTRLAELEAWIRNHGPQWGLDMSAWTEFESP